MTDHASARSVIRKITITAIVGALSFPLTDMIFSSLPAQFAMAAGFGSIVLLVQFLADFDKRLVGVEATQVESVAEMQRVVEKGFSKVNDATRLFAEVDAAGLKSVAVTRLVRYAAGIGADAAPLVCAFAQSEIDRVSDLLRELAEQEANYDGEDQDWLLGLTRSATESIDAISLPEVDAAGQSFWESDAGRRYLDLQREAVQRKVRVRRVFVIERDELSNPDLQRVCRTHADVGVEVRLLIPSAVPRGIRSKQFDFILFDNALSYEVTPAAHVEKGEPPMILNTRLILREAKIEERIERYREIWLSAMSWSNGVDSGPDRLGPTPTSEPRGEPPVTNSPRGLRG